MSSLRPVTGTPRQVVELLRNWLAAPDEPEPVIVETSGSTGAPKRVVLTRRAVLASVAATTRRLGAEGQWVLTLPPSYVAGLQVVVRSLVAGHEPVLLGEGGSFAEGLETLAGARSSTTEGQSVPEEVAQRSLVEEGVQRLSRNHTFTSPLFTSLVATQLHRMLDDAEETAALARCHTVLLGGGPIDPALRHRAEAAGVRIVATYGSSETAGGCVYDGHPLDGVAVAIGTDGRIRIGGPTLFEGYDGDPALTAETLVGGWFLTSDAGRLDEDGRLQVLGRLDDVVISGGVNVPTPAVARRLREHPAVQAAEVVGVPDPEWGHRVVAHVVGPISLGEARDWVAAVHPRSWAPREVVVVDELPLLANGKVDRQALIGGPA